MNTICPFMSDSNQEVACKENCVLYIAGTGKNCVLARLPIYYNQMRETITTLSNRVDTLVSATKTKV